MAIRSNLSSLRPSLDPCCDPKDSNRLVVLPDSVDPPLVQAFVNDTPEEEIPPEPPPTITAAQSQTVTFNDNNNQTQLFDPSLPPTIPAAESVSQPIVGDDPIPAIINLLRADNGIGMATATRWSARNFPSLDDAFSNVAYAAIRSTWSNLISIGGCGCTLLYKCSHIEWK